MNDLAPTTPLLPLPPCDVTARPATLDDVPFMDALQKQHAKQVGWMPTQTLEGKITLGHVLIATDVNGERVGYCIGNDQYFKRDDVGIIYQMNVVPGRQRGLIGATLLKAQFARSAYGCRLYCCWCAQDIAANKFWEAMGFVPLAFRAGSEKKSRLHIFWQKRIRAGDTGDPSRGGTPWWFPAKTDAGVMREDRLVLPIPPGVHWSDEMPRILPVAAPQTAIENKRPAVKARQAKLDTSGPVKHGPRQYGAPPSLNAAPPTAVAKPKPQKKAKVKADPKLIAAARELRDRWLEQVNAEPMDAVAGKYDVSRAIDTATRVELIRPTTAKLLAA